MIATTRKKKDSEHWKELLAHSITKPEEISDRFGTDKSEIEKVIPSYPMRINPYLMGLIKSRNNAIYKQVVPDIREITQTDGLTDPLNEEELSPVPGLTHKYPDRVLLLVSSQCASYCRFCNRKRKVGDPSMVTKKSIKEGIEYIRATNSIRDVLLSGGDPLVLSDNILFNILQEIRSIPHVKIIRIGTRVPCTLPHRITQRLVNIQRKDGEHMVIRNYLGKEYRYPAIA